MFIHVCINILLWSVWGCMFEVDYALLRVKWICLPDFEGGLHSTQNLESEVKFALWWHLVVDTHRSTTPLQGGWLCIFVMYQAWQFLFFLIHCLEIQPKIASLETTWQDNTRILGNISILSNKTSIFPTFASPKKNCLWQQVATFCPDCRSCGTWEFNPWGLPAHDP